MNFNTEITNTEITNTANIADINTNTTIINTETNMLKYWHKKLIKTRDNLETLNRSFENEYKRLMMDKNRLSLQYTNSIIEKSIRRREKRLVNIYACIKKCIVKIDKIEAWLTQDRIYNEDEDDDDYQVSSILTLIMQLKRFASITNNDTIDMSEIMKLYNKSKKFASLINNDRMSMAKIMKLYNKSKISEKDIRNDNSDDSDDSDDSGDSDDSDDSGDSDDSDESDDETDETSRIEFYDNLQDRYNELRSEKNILENTLIIYKNSGDYNDMFVQIEQNRIVNLYTGIKDQAKRMVTIEADMRHYNNNITALRAFLTQDKLRRSVRKYCDYDAVINSITNGDGNNNVCDYMR